MKVEQSINEKLMETFSPQVLDVINESHTHANLSTESHFKVIIVSQAFNQQRLIARHRAVNECLAAELAGEVHALSIHVYTPEEWETSKDSVPLSAKCLGGSLRK